MKSIVKLVLGLCGLLVVVLIAVVITVSTLDPNEYKDWISEKVQEETGRSLVLDGDLALSYYPWLGVEANGLTLGNATGFGEEPFFHADYIKLRVKLMPILKQQYEVDTVRINGAIINLAKNKEGRTNWQDLLPADQQEDAGPLPLAAVVLGGVDVQKASVNWHDFTTDTHYTITNMDITTDALSYGEPVTLQLAMDVLANKPAINAKVKLDGTIAYDIDAQLYNIKPLVLTALMKGANIPGGETEATLSVGIDLDLDKDTLVLSDLDLKGLDTAVSGSLNVSRVQTAEPAVQASIQVNGRDLAQLFKVAEIEPLASQIAKLADRSFKLEGRFDADMERGDIDVAGLELAMLGATVQGDVKVRNVSSATPGYKGQLKAAGPDLPTLLQVLGQFQGGRKSALTVYGRKFAKLDARSFRIDAGFDVDLKSGDIDVPTLDINTLGVSVNGNLKAKNMLADGGSIEGRLKVKGDKLAGLLVALDQKALSEQLRAIDFKAGISGNAANLNLKPMTLQATLQDTQLGKEAVDLVLKADTAINLDKQSLSMAGLSLQGLGLNLSGSLNVSHFLEAPAYNGELNLASFNLRALMDKLNQDLPVTADKKVFSKLALSTRFSGSATEVDLQDLSLALDQSNLKGSLTVSDFANPAYRFAIDIDKINVDRYLPPEQKGESIKPVTPETAAGAVAQLPLETLQSLKVDGRLSIGKLTVSKLKMTKVTLSLQGKDGQIQLDPVAANLYRGSYSGKISIDANDKLPKLVVNSALKGVQIEPLLKDVSGSADLVGLTDVSIAVVARGKNADAFKQTLSGQAELKVTNGVVRGVNVPRALEQVEVMLESKRFGKVNTTGNTPFDSLTATLPINGGIVNNSDLLLTAPGFRVTGKGMLARLVDMTWKYDLKVGVDRRTVTKNEQNYNLGDYTIPIICRGKIAGENCTADKMDLAGTAVKKIIIDKLINKDSTKPADGGANAQPNTDPSKELLDKALKSIFN